MQTAQANSAMIINGTQWVGPAADATNGHLFATDGNQNCLLISAAVLDFTGLPTSDPQSAGLLYRDPSTNIVYFSTGSGFTVGMDFSKPGNSQYVPMI